MASLHRPSQRLNFRVSQTASQTPSALCAFHECLWCAFHECLWCRVPAEGNFTDSPDINLARLVASVKSHLKEHEEHGHSSKGAAHEGTHGMLRREETASEPVLLEQLLEEVAD